LAAATKKARKCRTWTLSCVAGADGDADAAPAAPSVASPVTAAAPTAAARREICMMTHLLGSWLDRAGFTVAGLRPA
jgi:hypothetical protein